MDLNTKYSEWVLLGFQAQTYSIKLLILNCFLFFKTSSSPVPGTTKIQSKQIVNPVLMTKQNGCKLGSRVKRFGTQLFQLYQSKNSLSIIFPGLMS